jgi:hypothetical protein
METNGVLNELVAMHNRSLPMYLTYASPTWPRGAEKARETLELIAADQSETAERLAAAVLESGGVVNNGEFPMYYTGFHDLSFEYLLGQLIKEQKEDVASLEQHVASLSLAPMSKALAEEALGAAKGHLQSLEELKQPPSAS